MTEYLAEQPEIAALSTFDTDPAFVDIARTKAKELGLTIVHEILLLDHDATRRLPWADGAFDLVLAVGVVEHLPERHRRAQVDEYWRVLAPGGHIAFLDTPNRYFPFETHSVGFRSCSGCRPVWRTPTRDSAARESMAPCGSGNSSRTAPAGATPPSPSACRRAGEPASWTSPRRPATASGSSATLRARELARTLLPLFGAAARMLGAAGQPPSLALPYLNLAVPARTVRGRRDGACGSRSDIGTISPTYCCRTRRRSRGCRASRASGSTTSIAPSTSAIYSGDGAREYDRIHRYTEADAERGGSERLSGSGARGRDVGGRGYGRALELGRAADYFTTLIARHARSVVAIEPVPDIRTVLRRTVPARGARRTCRSSAPPRSTSPPTSARRRSTRPSSSRACITSTVATRCFRALGRVVRPGGRLFLVEPHHNLRRVVRLTRKYLAEYRAPTFWRDERNWATHDFLTRGELRDLCRQGGFTDVAFEGYWISGSRRLIVDPRRRFALERMVGRLPAVRHFAAVLALTARRRETERGG